MRLKLFASAILAFGLWSCVSVPGAGPSSAEVEAVVRAAMLDHRIYIPRGIREARMLEFDLVSVDETAPPRLRAEAEIAFEFRDPMPPALGFEQRRTGRYELLLTRGADGLELTRFSAKGRVHLLQPKG